MALTKEQFDRELQRYLSDRAQQVVSGVADDLGKAFEVGPRQPQGPTGQRETASWGEPPQESWGDPGVPPEQWGAQAGRQVPRGWVRDAARKMGRPEQPLWDGTTGQLGEWLGEKTQQAADFLTYRPPQTYGPQTTEWQRPELGPQPEDVNQPSNQKTDTGIWGQGTTTPTAQPASFTASPEVTEPAVATVQPPPLTAAAQPTTWESEFAQVHGRAPTSYDALVRQEMEKRMAPGQTPTRGDWEILTRDLNRRGVYGPREVPEFATPEHRAAALSGRPAPTMAQTAAAAPRITTPTAQQPTVQGRTLSLNQQGLERYRADIEDRANAYGVDANLVASLIQAESSFNPQAKGGAGEVGLMQLMPDTARGLGLTPDSYYHERSNIDAGTKYLASQLKAYDRYGDQQIPLALAAYNMGGANLNAVLRGEMQMPASTKAHVKSIMDLYEQMGR